MTTRTVFAIAVFLLLSGAIIWPLHAPGHLLTLDSTPFAFHLAPAITSPSVLFSGAYWLAGFILPADILQKTVLFFIFFLAGWGMYRLVPAEHAVPKLFAGILYAVNPFTYARVMAGHWYLLLAFALLPFWLQYAASCFHGPTIKKSVGLAIFSTVLISISIHFSLLIATVFAVYAAVIFLVEDKRDVIFLRFLAVFLLSMILFNLHWLIPSLLGQSPQRAAIEAFTRGDLIAFQSVPDPTFGLVFNLASGFGFWAEAYDYYVSAKQVVGLWPVLALIWMVLAITGVYAIYRKKRRNLYPITVTLLILYLLALDLAAGIAIPSFAGVTFYLYDHIHILRGFREPQKLVGIVVFVSAFFGGIGLEHLMTATKSRFRWLVVAALLVPFAYTPTIFGGFWGQLRPAFFPSSWTTVDKKLMGESGEFLTAVFPWHQYMRYKFINNRVIAHPAPFFFHRPVLSAQNYETIPLYSHDTRPEGLHVEGLLSIQQDGVNLLGEKVEEKPRWATDLAVVDVQYVILFKDSDWKKYRFLNEDPDLVKESEDATLILYKNLAFGKPVPPPEYTEPTLLSE